MSAVTRYFCVFLSSDIISPRLISFSLSHVTKHTQSRKECNKLKSLLNQCCAPSAETYRSYFSDTRWHDLAEPLCSSSTPISSLFPFGCSRPSEKIQNTASNPLRWLTARQALYRAMGLTFYGPTVGCYQPEGGRSRTEGQCINQGWNVASVKPESTTHIQRRLCVGLIFRKHFLVLCRSVSGSSNCKSVPLGC